MKEKIVTIAIIALFLGLAVSPLILAEVKDIEFVGQSPISFGGKVIAVDDEGDGNYTSIKEAVNNASSGDIIEVYSGTYYEQEICIVNDNITLLGISHELGEGGDSGKPFIKGNGTDSGYIIRVLDSYVTVSNFIIENSGPGSSCIRVGTDLIKIIYNITIRDCIIRYSSSIGIYIRQRGTIWNITIINNNISHCKGISFIGSARLADQKSCIITGNVITDSPYWGINFDGESGIISGNDITDCHDIGIQLQGNWNNISGNRIRRCRIGIQLGGINNIVNGNDIDSCPVGIQYAGDRNIITKNNFKNYSRIGIWFERWFGEQYNLLLKSRWIGNYWDTWIGVGPKIIFGLQAIPYVSHFYPFLILGFEFDLHPAKEPYNIP